MGAMMPHWEVGQTYSQTLLSLEEWQSLWAQGFRWLSCGDRYQFVDGPGLLTPQRVASVTLDGPARFWQWSIYDEVETTMAVAQRALWTHRRPVAILASQQRAGRGRRGRGWTSIPGGSVLLSLGWLPPIEWLQGPLTLAAGVAAVEALETLMGLRLFLKWPNDGVADDQKFMGVLSEAGVDPVPWVVIGVGINVNGALPSTVPNATTLESLTGRPWPRDVVAVAVASGIARMIAEWHRTGAQPLLDRWRHHNVTLGRPVLVYQSKDPWAGFAEDLTPGGALVVRRLDGQTVMVTAGEVTLRPQPSAWEGAD